MNERILNLERYLWPEKHQDLFLVHVEKGPVSVSSASYSHAPQTSLSSGASRSGDFISHNPPELALALQCQCIPNTMEGASYLTQFLCTWGEVKRRHALDRCGFRRATFVATFSDENACVYKQQRGLLDHIQFTHPAILTTASLTR